MNPTKLTPPHSDLATMRLSLDVDRAPGDRLAELIEEVRRSTGDGVFVVGLCFEPVVLELCGPRASLEALRTRPLSEGLRRALGSWKASFHPISLGSRPAARRGRRVLVVDGDLDRARQDVEALGRSRIDACAVGSIDAAEVMMQRSGLVFDAVVLRHRLSDGDGLVLLDRVGVPERGCSVLVIDDHAQPERAREYRKRGVFRYIARPAGALQLVGRINATMLDTQAWRQAEHTAAEEPDEPPRMLVDPQQGADRLKHVCRLSDIEREVAVMVLLGLRDLEIAEKLGQSERTAKRYVGKVLEKAGIQNRASLWGVLHQDGLGTMPPREPERQSAVPSQPPVARPGAVAGQPPSRPPVPSSVPTWPV